MTVALDNGQHIADARYKLYLGPLWDLLADENTTAIVCNEDDSVWVEQFNQPKRKLEEPMLVEHRRRLISYLANQKLGRAMDEQHSRLQCDLPVFGSRVQAFCDPIARWPIILRNHARHVVAFDHFLKTAAPGELASEGWGEDRVRSGWGEAILEAMTQRRNIIVAGGTKSGKTTFLNSLVQQHAGIYPHERLIVVQDRREIVASAFGDHLILMARVEQAKAGENGTTSFWTYEFMHAVEDAMRCDGDTIVWNEIRDPHSAIGLGAASNTGTRGIKSTIHATSIAKVPGRFEELYLEGGRSPVKGAIANLCELVIYMQMDQNTNKGRIVDVQRCLGVDASGEYIFEGVRA